MNICQIPGGWRSQLYHLPHGFIMSFELVRNVLTCEWWPREPSREEAVLMFDHYRDARSDFLQRTGLSVVIVDLPEVSDAAH